MKRVLVLFLIQISILGFVSAQTDGSYTLQECIDYALQNESNLKNAQIDTEISQAKIREIRALGYPQIEGNISMVDNPALQKMFFSPTNPFVAGSGGSPPSGAKKSGEIIVLDNFFQLRSAGDANAQLSQLIFDGSYVVGLQAASAYGDMSQKALARTKIETVEHVTKAYYAALIAEESSKMYNINLMRLDSSLYELKAYYNNGLVEDIDVKRLEVQYNNLKTDKENAENLLQLSTLSLKLSMGMPLEIPISLQDSLNSIEINAQALGDESYDVTQRIEFSLLETQEKLAYLDLKRYKYSRLPSLAAFAKGGMVRQDVKFTNLVRNEWFGYGMFGISMKVPIMDFTRHYKIQQARYATEQLKNSKFALENGLKMETQTSKLNFNNSLKRMETQKRNLELAQEVVKVTKIKYKEGVGSNIEVVNAEADLQEAQINYYRALYDAMVAKINHQKATGKLYNE